MKIKIIVFLLVTVSFLCGCTVGSDTTLPPDAIPVLSNYPNLTYLVPGDFDADLSQDPQWAKHGYSTYVAEVDGKLAVMPDHSDGSSTSPGVEAGQCYYVGDLWGGAKGVFVAGGAVISEPCIGMVTSADGTRVLVFTTADEKSKVHAFEKEGGGWSVQDDSIVLDGRLHLLFLNWPNANYDPPEKVYLLTDRSIIVIRSQDYLLCRGDFSTISAEALPVPEWWGMVEPTSAVQINQELFVGDRQGIIKFVLENGTATYYPIDYRSLYKGG